MKLYRSIALALALAILAACATQPQTAQQTVYLATADYNAAARIIIAYKALPKCGSPAATVICSRDDVIAQLKAADTVAYEALKAAETTARSPGAGANAQTAIVAANQAIAALARVTAQLNLK
jgi:hypothetical protein